LQALKHILFLKFPFHIQNPNKVKLRTKQLSCRLISNKLLFNTACSTVSSRITLADLGFLEAGDFGNPSE